MKHGTVNIANLKNCWSAAKLSNCVGCSRYKTCNYPDRLYDEYYDRMLEKKAKLLGQMRKTDADIASYESYRDVGRLKHEY